MPEAIGFAVGLSIVDVVRRSVQPHDAVLGWVDRLSRWADVAVHPSARVVPRVVVYRLDDRLFFANHSYVSARTRRRYAAPRRRCTISYWTPRAMTHVDSARVWRRIRSPCGSRMEAPVHDRLEAARIVERIGSDHFHATVRAAVRASTDGGR